MRKMMAMCLLVICLCAPMMRAGAEQYESLYLRDAGANAELPEVQRFLEIPLGISEEALRESIRQQFGYELMTFQESFRDKPLDVRCFGLPMSMSLNLEYGLLSDIALLYRMPVEEHEQAHMAVGFDLYLSMVRKAEASYGQPVHGRLVKSDSEDRWWFNYPLQDGVRDEARLREFFFAPRDVRRSQFEIFDCGDGKFMKVSLVLPQKTEEAELMPTACHLVVRFDDGLWMNPDGDEPFHSKDGEYPWAE